MPTRTFWPKYAQLTPDPLFLDVERHILVCSIEAIPGNGGSGELVGGALEGSNVDLTTEAIARPGRRCRLRRIMRLGWSRNLLMAREKPLPLPYFGGAGGRMALGSSSGPTGGKLRWVSKKPTSMKKGWAGALAMN